MCGIIAVVRRPSTRPTPTADAVLALIVEPTTRLAHPTPLGAGVDRAEATPEEVDALPDGHPILQVLALCIFDAGGLIGPLLQLVARLESLLV